MNQTGNKNDLSSVLNSLGGTAEQVSSFLNALKNTLTDEQKQALDKELGMTGGFNSQMNKVSSDMTQALKDLENFNKGQ